MKQLQVILTVEVNNDQYSSLLDGRLDIGTIVYHGLEDDDGKTSFDFPAVLIPKFINE